jgi:hypothetical protein
MVWLLATVPAADVNAPPSIEYSPPVMEIGALALMPEMTTSLEPTTVEASFHSAARTRTQPVWYRQTLGVVSGYHHLRRHHHSLQAGTPIPTKSNVKPASARRCSRVSN